MPHSPRATGVTLPPCHPATPATSPCHVASVPFCGCSKLLENSLIRKRDKRQNARQRTCANAAQKRNAMRGSEQRNMHEGEGGEARDRQTFNCMYPLCNLPLPLTHASYLSPTAFSCMNNCKMRCCLRENCENFKWRSGQKLCGK